MVEMPSAEEGNPVPSSSERALTIANHSKLLPPQSAKKSAVSDISPVREGSAASKARLTVR